MKPNKKILEKTLAQLEKELADEVFPAEMTPLIGRERELARKPLKDFTPGNLRFMIQQGFGWKYLIPLAIEILVENPLISGDYYEGDLLKAVLSVDRKFWLENAELWSAVYDIAGEVEVIHETIETTIFPSIEDFRKIYQ